MAVVGLPDLGEISYNGFTFEGAYTAELQANDINDEAGRTVIYTEYLLDIKGFVGDALVSTVDNEVGNLQRRLSKQGQRLVIHTKGFGQPIVIGGGSGDNDVKFGPIPQLRSFDSAGGNQCMHYHWQCLFRLQECGGQYLFRGVLAANYSVRVRIDEHGNTSRTIDGYVEVANNRIGRKIVETPDNFRTFIKGDPPLGFKRVQDYDFDQSKSRVKFSIADTKIATHHNAYPRYINEAEGTFRTSWSMAKAAKIRNSMRFNLTPRADISQTECWLMAYSIVQSKLEIQRAAKFLGRRAGTIIDSVEVEESIYGRPVSIALSWFHLHSLKDLIPDSGLFVPVDGSTWDTWRTSMRNWAHDERGNDKWALTTNDDLIIDLCNSANARIIINDSVATWPIKTRVPLGLVNEKPPPEQSYIKHRQKMHIHNNRPVVQQRILQTSDVSTGNTSQEDPDVPDFGQVAGIDDVVQQSGRASYTVTYTGQAVRAGYPVPKPKVTHIGGREAVEVGGDMQQHIAHNALGIAIYVAWWRYHYVMGNSPGKIKPLPNIEQKVDENGNPV